MADLLLNSAPSSENVAEQPETPRDQEPIQLDLQYPQVFTGISFITLVARSYPSTSSSSITSMLPTQPPARDLSESWASLSSTGYVGESDLESENTDAVSLIDVSGSDDARSAEELETSSESGYGAEERNVTFENGEDVVEQPTGVSSFSDLQDTLPELPVPSSALPPPLEFVKFEEPEQWLQSGLVELRQRLKVFDAEGLKQIHSTLKPRTEDCQYIGTMRMAVSKKSLQLNQPFKVLLSGPALESRGEIVRKLGDILVAGNSCSSHHQDPNHSRYHVIPLEYGPGSLPTQAEVIPIQTQIVIEDCIDATHTHDSEDEAQVKLTFQKGDIVYSQRDGLWQTGLDYQPWAPPDIAVIILRRDNDLNRQRAIMLLLKCMTEHGVPSIVITETGDWFPQADQLTSDMRSLHRCIEVKTTGSSAAKVLRRIPIDLETFLDLDPKQLNQHIACLAGTSKPPPVKSESIIFAGAKSEKRQTSELANDVEKNLTKSFVAQSRKSGSFCPQWSLKEAVLWLVVLFVIVWPPLSMLYNRLPVMVSTLMEESIEGSTQASVASVLGHLPITSKDPPAETAVPSSNIQSLRGQKDLAQLFASPRFKSANASDDFQVEIVGDCHIVVNAPKTIVRWRGANVLIRVTRGPDEIKISTLKLFDGVYAVKVPREDAHGLLRTCITVGCSPLNQTFDLDFGPATSSSHDWTWAGLQPVLCKLQHYVVDVQIKMLSLKGLLRTQSLPTQDMACKSRVNLSERARGTYDRFSEQACGVLADVAARSQMGQVTLHSKIIPEAREFIVQAATRAIGISREFSTAAEEQVVDLKYKFDLLLRRSGTFAASIVSAAWQEATHSQTLGKAQDRARRLVHDSTEKLKQHRTKSQKKVCDRHTCKGGGRFKAAV